MELKFKKLQEDAVLPSYANPNDAGLDLTAISFTQEFDKSGKLVLVYHERNRYHIFLRVQLFMKKLNKKTRQIRKST